MDQWQSSWKTGWNLNVVIATGNQAFLKAEFKKPRNYIWLSAPNTREDAFQPIKKQKHNWKILSNYPRKMIYFYFSAKSVESHTKGFG